MGASQVMDFHQANLLVVPVHCPVMSLNRFYLGDLSLCLFEHLFPIVLSQHNPPHCLLT